MTITEYVDIVSKRFQSGISREHSYRGDLETLIRSLVLGIDVTNEPANVTDCGNPDYVITKGKIPIGYIEAKDIGKDLNGKNFKEQFGRYKKALDNLIITDYVWFQFFQNGVLVHEIKIADTENNAVKPLPENFSKFESTPGALEPGIVEIFAAPKTVIETGLFPSICCRISRAFAKVFTICRSSPAPFVRAIPKLILSVKP